MSQMSKTMRKITVTIAILLASSVSAIFGTQQAYAGDLITGDGDLPTGGDCSAGWFSECLGVVWRYYPTKSNDVTIYRQGAAYNHSSSDGNWHIVGCGDAGGYYRLGYALFYGTSYRSLDGSITGRPEEQGGQIGIYAMSGVSNAGGARKGAGRSGTYAVYREGDPYGESWNTVMNKFNSYAAMDTSNHGKTWGGNLGWFCYNPDWEKPNDTYFSSYSIVNSKETGRVSTGNLGEDKNKVWDITTEKDKVRVTFSHKLWYHNGNRLPTNAGDAETDWEIEMTRDGEGYYNDSKDFVDWETDYYGTFSTPGYNKRAVDMNLYEIGIQTYDIDVSNLRPGEKTLVCSKIIYSPKTIVWKNDKGKVTMDKGKSSGRANSTGCVQIIKGGGENVEFWSNSSARASYGSRIESKTSPVDGNTDLTIRLDAEDNSPVTVDFWHNIHYTGQIPENLNQDICTSFTFDSNSAIKPPIPPTIIDESSLGGNQYCANKHESMSKDAPETTRGSESDAVGKGSSVVIENIKQGEKRVVCQTINYIPKSYLIFQDEKANNVSVDEGSGSGSSTACVTIIKEEGVEPPKVEIKLDNDVYYVGETAHLTWTVSADSNYEKKLLEGVMFYYQAPVDVGPSSAVGVMEEKANQKDPETYYGDRNKGFRDGNYETVDFTPGFEHSFVDPNDYKLKDSAQDKIDGHVYHSSEIEPSMETIHFNDDKTIEIVVPDNVGDKICVGLAAHYQNYKIEDSTETHRWRTGTDRWGYPIYTSEDHTVHQYVKDGEHYWLVEGATCHPIVKKPALSVWNGSTSAAEDITTSISNRYNPADFGVETKDVPDSSRHKFGSWTEYLAVVNGVVETGGDGKLAKFGFSSGASYAYLGASYASELLVNNSPLTIANKGVDKPGSAGVASSSTFFSRLSTYLSEDKAAITGTKVYSSLAEGVNASGSRIVRTSGDITIDNSIVFKTTNANSIYQIPQLIIYTDGNINIGPNVDRIDAWLIAGGKVNTCSSYKDGSTEAAVATDTYTFSPISGDPNSKSTCSKQLTINGPVIAKSIDLNRTAGSDPLTYKDVSKLSAGGNVADPRSITGEIFNLGADTYLWGYAQASRYSSSYTEAYSRELPPRY